MTSKNPYNQSRYQAKRAWMFAQLGGRCSVCDTTENLKLVYKNKADARKFHVCRNWSASKDRLTVELRKCILLCKFHYGESLAKHQIKEPVYKNFDIFDTEEL